MGRRPLVPILFLTVSVFVGAGCGGGEDRTEAGDSSSALSGRLIIFHAASLAKPLDDLKDLFQQRHPKVQVVLESGSSRLAIRKVTDLGREADIVAAADASLLDLLMVPEYAGWTVSFARNRVVIGYTDQSKYRDEITPENWFRILLREGVSFGCCDRNMAPLGYRTRLVWRLADDFYGPLPDGRKISEALEAKLPARHVRPHANELIPLLTAMGIDYVFQYESVALQHRLQFLRLPPEIDLSEAKFADRYARAKIELIGKGRGSRIVRVGKPIVYGVTLVKDAPNRRAALAFLELLLGPEGQETLKREFQDPLRPPRYRGAAPPPEPLRALVSEDKP